MVHIVYLTGVSGAGISTAAHAFEEKGYRIIQNVPNELLLPLVKKMKSEPDAYGKTTLVQEIASAKDGLSILNSITGVKVTSIALYCNKDELLKRYRLDRHIHPLQARGYEIDDALALDEANANTIRDAVDLFLDTSNFSPDDLREFLLSNVRNSSEAGLAVSFQSFGYKYGIPSGADYVIDCRDLPNPYWDKELRQFTGLDQPVIEFFQSKKDVAKYIKHIESFLNPIFEKARKNGRKFIFVYLGCSGGQHRSVYIANALFELFKDRYYCMVSHRDMPKNGSPS